MLIGKTILGGLLGGWIGYLISMLSVELFLGPPAACGFCGVASNSKLEGIGSFIGYRAILLLLHLAVARAALSTDTKKRSVLRWRPLWWLWGGVTLAYVIYLWWVFNYAL